MAFLTFNNVIIKGIAACVPKSVFKNAESTLFTSEQEREKVISSIGINQKRVADTDVTAADLSFAAADKLMNDLEIDRSSIDVLIFLSQTSDYVTPATAPSLQNRLGLPITTACFDINLACSGYVYALSTAFAYAGMPGIKRVLLLNGETFSKVVSPLDKVNYPLYGDAGTATLIENDASATKSFFELYSDGAGKDSVMIKAGGARMPANSLTIELKEREDNNFRSDHHLYMNGIDVFNFALLRVPPSVKEMLSKTQNTIEDTSYFFFHQANKFMTDFIAKKLKISLDKVPYSLTKYGNTSSCSIPLTIASEGNKLENKKNVMLVGFGGGLSWGTSYLDLSQCYVADVFDY